MTSFNPNLDPSLFTERVTVDTIVKGRQYL